MSAIDKIGKATEALRGAQRQLHAMEEAAKRGLSLATVLTVAEQVDDKIHEALEALGE